jgi:hypothetical protein
MNNFFSKKLLALLIAPAYLFSFAIKADRANFSGDWSLNESKSDLGQYGSFVPRKIKVAQKNDSIIIARTSQSFTGDEVTSTEALSFDGKETETTIYGSSKKKSSSKWSDDGQTLTITYTLLLDLNGQITEIKGTETWTSSDGSKTLLQQNNSSSSFGDDATRCVYEKK